MLLWQSIILLMVVTMIGLTLIIKMKNKIKEIESQLDDLEDDINEPEETKPPKPTHISYEEARNIDWKNVKFK